MDPVKRSLISLHITVIFLAAASLFSALLPLNPVDITFGRSIVACVILFTFLRVTKTSLKLESMRCYMIALGLGLLMAAHWTSYFAALQYASVSVGMIALFTFPVITVLLEPLFERFKLAWQDLVSGIVVLIGIYLIMPNPSLTDDVTVGVLIGLGSAILYALRNLLHRKYFSHYGGAKAMAYQILTISACLIFFVSPNFINSTTQTWLYILLLGTVFTAIPHALVATSLKHLRAKTFSLIACMQPFYGVILAIIILNERPTFGTLIGGILVTSASIYETLNAHTRTPSTVSDK